jgi:hypothetical protein
LPAARRSANGQSDLIGQKGGRFHEPGNALDGSLCEGGGEMVHSTPNARAHMCFIASAKAAAGQGLHLGSRECCKRGCFCCSH